MKKHTLEWSAVEMGLRSAIEELSALRLKDCNQEEVRACLALSEALEAVKALAA